MLKTFPEKLEAGRLRSGPFASRPQDPFGYFLLQGPTGAELKIVASGGDPSDPVCAGWEHVSVSVRHRTPNWTEMCFVKDLFWDPEECVIQFHPPRSEYVNNHPFVLHMWRPVDNHVRLPPSIMVGVKSKGILTREEAMEISKAMGHK